MRCIRTSKLIKVRNKRPDSPTLVWSSLQHLLENAVPPVLIILDCCFAANAARDTTEGTTKEILAACGRENPTLGAGLRSFTSALIEELVAFGRAPFTVAMLHSRLVTMRWRLAFTPIYALLSEHGGHSIELGPMPLPIDQSVEIGSSDSARSDEVVDSPTPEASPTLAPSQQSVSATAADTRVLLAVSIIGDAVPDISEWKSWLTSQTPWDVSKIDVRVEAVFESHSTLLLASLPIFAWDILPHKAAYHFVGFVKSQNLEQPRSSSRLAAQKSKTKLSPRTETPTPSFADSTLLTRASHERLQNSSTAKKDGGSQASSSIHESPSIPQKRSFSDFYLSSSRSNQDHPKMLSPPLGVSTVAPTTKEPTVHTNYHTRPYAKESANTKKSVSSGPAHHTAGPSDPWTPEDDARLKQARKDGMNWEPIAKTWFPSKTANACRKRHERLMEKVNTTEEWDSAQLEAMEIAYYKFRERMWKFIADEINEKWQTVESKVSADLISTSGSRLLTSN